tara:strand:- start:3552 stop:4316 length:765 start_codon:yes stop_codon:yes gene_type:complete
MSLSLKESCHLFEKYCRRNSDTPTFQDFNSKHFTCLPLYPVVFEEYRKGIDAARRATGLPVTRRLPSLFRKLNLYRKQSDLPDFVSDNMSYTPTVQIAPQCSAHTSNVPGVAASVKMNIRAPGGMEQEPEEPEEQRSNVDHLPTLIQEPLKWTRESYAQKVSESKSILLKESSGHMVHLVPETHDGCSLESLASKLTKNTWENLRGKGDGDLKMRDGSKIIMTTISLDEGDLAEFIQNRKNKISGPHFIRFSRI